LLTPVGLTALVPSNEKPLAGWWLAQRAKVDLRYRTTLDCFVLLVCWGVWKERNKRTFNSQSSTVIMVAQDVAAEAEDWAQAGFSCISLLTPFWSREFVTM